MVNSPTALAVAATIGWVSYKLWNVGRREPSLPPGPPTKPLLGNILEFPRQTAYYQFTEWAKTYGEIFSLKIASATVIILNSPGSVRDVMDSKGNAMLTGDRPKSYVADRLYRGLNVPFAAYGDEWRTCRRAVLETLNPQARERLLPMQMGESAQMMHDLLTNPKGHYEHVGRLSTSMALCITVGQRAPRSISPLAVEVDGFTAELNELMQVGAIPPVDLIPSLAYIPERWAPWKTKVSNLERRQTLYYTKLLQESKARAAKGAGGEATCLFQIACDRQKELKLTDEMIMQLGPSILDAASVVGGTLANLFILLLAHPEVQKKAQLELDAVVGSDRQPTLDDMDQLPYVRAIIEEVHRVRPVGPLGVPHAASDDVMYKGYRIPKGSIVIHNTWAVFHDPALFDDPYTFNPERFIASPIGVKAGLDTADLSKMKDMAFGAGRRACPGKQLGMQMVDLVTSRLLWGFDILKAKTSDGQTIEPDMDALKPALENLPAPFLCDVRPRSAKHATIIRQDFVHSTPVLSEYEREIDENDRVWLAKVREEAERY